MCVCVCVCVCLSTYCTKLCTYSIFMYLGMYVFKYVLPDVFSTITISFFLQLQLVLCYVGKCSVYLSKKSSGNWQQ